MVQFFSRFFLAFILSFSSKRHAPKGNGYCASVRTMTRVRGLRNSKILIGTKKKQNQRLLFGDDFQANAREKERERGREKKKRRTKGRARSAARASNNDDDDGFLFCVFDSSEGVRWWWWWCVVFFKVSKREDDWWAFGEEKTTTASSEERRRGREILRARRREDGGEIFISRCIYSFRRRRQMRENHPSE